MNQPQNPNPNPLNDNPPPKNSDNEMEVVEVYNPDTKVMLERFTLMLIAVGLIIGGIISVGVVYVLQKTGLTTPPNQQQIERGR